MNANRPFTVASALSEFASVDVVTTDFDHWTKRQKPLLQVSPINKIVYIKTPRYNVNIGLRRLISHLVFTFRAALFFRKCRSKYEVVYITFPFNILAWTVLGWSRGKRTIVDITDVWPDVLPFPRKVRIALAPFFRVWKWFFKAAVARADLVMSVSDEFIDNASAYTRTDAKIKRFYISHNRLFAEATKQQVFTVAYVGTIGHLYDFETLLNVMSMDELRDKVQLYVIGKGDREEWLINRMERLGIQYRFWGVVYDVRKLGSILCSCHIGFNGYINTTAAFSYKASTYFAAGLPIINSMKGDLWYLVSAHGLGANYEAGNQTQLKECLLQLHHRGIEDMAMRSARFFDSNVESSRVASEMKSFLRNNL